MQRSFKPKVRNAASRSSNFCDIVAFHTIYGEAFRLRITKHVAACISPYDNRALNMSGANGGGVLIRGVSEMPVAVEFVSSTVRGCHANVRSNCAHQLCARTALQENNSGSQDVGIGSYPRKVLRSADMRAHLRAKEGVSDLRSSTRTSKTQPLSSAARTECEAMPGRSAPLLCQKPVVEVSAVERCLRRRLFDPRLRDPQPGGGIELGGDNSQSLPRNSTISNSIIRECRSTVCSHLFRSRRTERLKPCRPTKNCLTACDRQARNALPSTCAGLQYLSGTQALWAGWRSDTIIALNSACCAFEHSMDLYSVLTGGGLFASSSQPERTLLALSVEGSVIKGCSSANVRRFRCPRICGQIWPFCLMLQAVIEGGGGGVSLIDTNAYIHETVIENCSSDAVQRQACHSSHETYDVSFLMQVRLAFLSIPSIFVDSHIMKTRLSKWHLQPMHRKRLVKLASFDAMAFLRIARLATQGTGGTGGLGGLRSSTENPTVPDLHLNVHLNITSSIIRGCRSSGLSVRSHCLHGTEF
eukprot:6172693-Pleurochrysis_carterae.AAC.5